jgi:hypothetical protein
MSFRGPQALLGRKQRQKCLPIIFRNAHISSLPLGTKSLVLTPRLQGIALDSAPSDPLVRWAIRDVATVAVNVDQYSARCGLILELQSPGKPCRGCWSTVRKKASYGS